MRLRSFGLTNRGRRRPHNEDAFVCDDALGLFLVADGVGGHAKGEVASREAVTRTHEFVTHRRSLLEDGRALDVAQRRATLRQLLEGAVQSAGNTVFGLAARDPGNRGMSTTLSALLVTEQAVATAHVGDSRIYRVRDGVCCQLTEDHTLVNYQLKQGLISPHAARTARGKNVITRALGQRDTVEVDTRELDVAVGDRYLLCSDGLHGYLMDDEPERLLADGPIERAPQRFVDLANERGGRDNITIVVVALE